MTIKTQYLPMNKYSRPGTKRPETRAIILHWVNNAGTSAQFNRDYFAGLAMQKPAKGVDYVFASTQYVIGLQGEIIQTMPVGEIARHCGSDKLDPASGKVYTDIGRKLMDTVANPNTITIGIELCHPDKTGCFNDTTLDSAIDLVTDLCKRYDLDPSVRVLRHYDIVGWKDCPRWYVEHPDEWDTFKHIVAAKINIGRERI